MSTGSELSRGFGLLAIICAAPFLLTACQTESQSPAPRDNRAAIAMLQKVNGAAQTCWVQSGDKDFKDYRVIPELDTRVGKPRILIMKAGAAQGLPVYVIEADGTPASLSAYGPLASEPIGRRINSDISRWRTGSKTCTA